MDLSRGPPPLIFLSVEPSAIWTRLTSNFRSERSGLTDNFRSMQRPIPARLRLSPIIILCESESNFEQFPTISHNLVWVSFPFRKCKSKTKLSIARHRGCHIWGQANEIVLSSRPAALSIRVSPPTRTHHLADELWVSLAPWPPFVVVPPEVIWQIGFDLRALYPRIGVITPPSPPPQLLLRFDLIYAFPDHAHTLHMIALKLPPGAGPKPILPRPASAPDCDWIGLSIGQHAGSSAEL